MESREIALEKLRKYKPLIITASIAVPLIVALLFSIKIDGYDTSFIPAIYASINGITAALLIVAIIAIKQKKIELHKRLIQVSIFLSLVFLVLYIIRHITSEPTLYGYEDFSRYVYYFLLITHILLSIIIIPLVLISYVRGILRLDDLHVKIVKWSFPIWLYVAISGVVVYLMIAPFYN